MTRYSSETDRSSSSTVGTTPVFSYSTPLCTSRVASPPSSRIMFGPMTVAVGVAELEELLGGPPVLGEGLALPGEHRHALGLLGGAVRSDDGGRGRVVLRGEDVAGHPAHLGAEAHQGLDQHGGLHGHVQRAGDAGAVQGPGLGVLAAQLHQAGHLVLGEPDLLAAELGERQVGDGEVDAVALLETAAGRVRRRARHDGNLGRRGHGVDASSAGPLRGRTDFTRQRRPSGRAARPVGMRWARCCAMTRPRRDAGGRRGAEHAAERERCDTAASSNFSGGALRAGTPRAERGGQ